MTPSKFKQCLDSITLEQWSIVVDGGALLLVDDDRVEVGSHTAPNAIIAADRATPRTAVQLQQSSQQKAEEILANYYRSHPLTPRGFNHQAACLIGRLGAEKFAATEGQTSQYSLFVDGGEVIAEAAGNPRHPYGTYCELSRFNSLSPAEQVSRWIESGEAYERYLSMNVCRYNC